jgi:hypothetical protein
MVIFPIDETVKNLPAMQETWFNTWVGKILWRRERLPTPVQSMESQSQTGLNNFHFHFSLSGLPGEMTKYKSV